MSNKSEPRQRSAFIELQTGLRIDKHALEDVCVTHPELFYEVANKVAMLVSERDAAKQFLQEEEARIDAALRHEADIVGEKITENEVKNKKLLHPDVNDAQDVLQRANEAVGKWTALKDAYHQRGYVLRDLVQLHLAQYYGSAATDKIEGKVKSATAEYAKRELNRARRER